MDQALYAKANVRSPGSTKTSTLKFSILRLGTFHTIFNLLSIIGKRFEDAGLHEICTENQGYSQKLQSQTSSKEMYNHAH